MSNVIIMTYDIGPLTYIKVKKNARFIHINTRKNNSRLY